MLTGIYNAQYIGNTMCGFENAHDYCIEIKKDEYGYQVHSITDLTDCRSSSAYIPYASENSLKRSWILEELHED